MELKTKKTKVKISDPVDFATVGVAKLLRNLQTQPLIQTASWLISSRSQQTRQLWAYN